MILAAVGNGTLALGAGTTLALGAALLVLAPLWREEITPDDARAAVPDNPAPAVNPEASAVEALREIEFDRATGKLSDADYAALKSTYTRAALAELRARGADAAISGAHSAEPEAVASVDAAVADDPVEAALAAYRARHAVPSVGGPPICVEHGARPEADAAFCSDCGRFLAGRCPACGATCDRAAQRFCAACGHSLIERVAPMEPAAA